MHDNTDITIIIRLKTAVIS